MARGFFFSGGNSGKYFCKTFFPEVKKDYAERQTKWTVLFKKKIIKSTATEIILYKNQNFNGK